MSDHQSTLDLVWPQAPAGHIYAHASFPGGHYISTGYFPAASLGTNGSGRTEDNLAGCTSLLFDLDLIDYVDAWRHAQGQVLEGKAADRKKWMWDNVTDELLGELKAEVGNHVLNHLVSVIGAEPTAVVDSGWGLHFHYAVAETLRDEQAALKDFHRRVVREVNERIAAESVSLTGGDGYIDALDPATCDVGTRVVRDPGTVNTKCPTRHKVCTVLDGTTTVLTDCQIEAVNSTLPLPSQKKKTSKKKTSSSGAAQSIAQPSETPGTINFEATYISDGRTLAEVASSLEVGEREDIICPFAGTSVGSAFVKKESTGACFMRSNALNRTYWHVNPAFLFTLNLSGVPAAVPPTPGQTPPPPPPIPPQGGQQPPPPPPVPPQQPQRTLATLQRRMQANGTPGAVLNIPANLIAMLLQDSLFDFWWDDFRQVAMRGTQPVNIDTYYIDVLAVMSDDYQWNWSAPKGLITDCIIRICQSVKRNPVTEYLEGLSWDGTARVESWIERVILDPGAAAGCSPVLPPLLDLYRTYGRRWAISLVARAMDPGCKMDTQLIFYGRQGFGKQHVWRSWCPFEDLYADTPIDPRNKDAYLTLQKSWIYEDAELASGTRAMEEAKKAFLSSYKDTFRPPYGRSNITVKRTCVIVGSTNEQTFLKDKTGSRRYWVIECPEIEGVSPFDPSQPKADYQWLLTNREQLLAEAVALYKGGEQWWLKPDEDACRDAVNREEYTHESEWDACARAVFLANRGGEKNAITCADFASAVDSELSVEKIAKMGYTLANALTNSGFKRGGKKKGRSTYYKPVPEGTAVMAGNGLSSANPSNGYTANSQNTWGKS